MLGLKYLREYVEISTTEFAKQLGVSQSSISYWENGRQPIPEKRLQQISFMTGVPKGLIVKEVSEDDRRKIEECSTEYLKVVLNMRHQLSSKEPPLDYDLEVLKERTEAFELEYQKTIDAFYSDIKAMPWQDRDSFEILQRVNALLKQPNGQAMLNLVIRGVEAYFDPTKNETMKLAIGKPPKDKQRNPYSAVITDLLEARFPKKDS